MRSSFLIRSFSKRSGWSESSEELADSDIGSKRRVAQQEYVDMLFRSTDPLTGNGAPNENRNSALAARQLLYVVFDLGACAHRQNAGATAQFPAGRTARFLMRAPAELLG